MKRTKQPKTPSAILSGDWHIREDTPECRTDDFWNVQYRKLHHIAKLQRQYQCPIYFSGDMFHHWKASPILLSMFFKLFHSNMDWEDFAVFGNHDLPQHSLELREKSGLRTLIEARAFTELDQAHWGQEPTEPSILIPHKERSVLVWHVMTWRGEEPWPGCVDLEAKDILKKYPQYDLIVTGHNHKPFIEEYKGRLLVNPGSITRQKANETHNPRVYLWYADINEVVPYTLPHDTAENVITRKHLERKEKNEQRYEAVINKLKEETTPEISFRHNLIEHCKKNKISQEEQDLIWKNMEE